MAAMKLIVVCALALAVESVPMFPIGGEGIGIGAGIYPGGIGVGIGGLGGGLGGLGGYGGGLGLGGLGGFFPGLLGFKDKAKDGAKSEEAKPAGPIKLEPHSDVAAHSNPAAAAGNAISGVTGSALNTLANPIAGAAATAARVAAAPIELAAGAAGSLVNGAANLAKEIL